MRDPKRGKASWPACVALLFLIATPAVADEPVPPTLTLAALEQRALERNPTLGQAAALIEAARGRAQQAGVYPNPTVGYVGERIGAGGTAGEMQGLFVDQTIVTAGKLRLDRAKYTQDVSQAEALALAQHYRVVNGVRVSFYRLLAMQRLLEVRSQLLRVAEDAVLTTEELVNVGAANQPDLLQARIEARQERVALENALTRYEAAWRELAARVGDPSLPESRLDGDLEAVAAVPDMNTTLARLLEARPEIQAARAEVARTRIGLERERVEPGRAIFRGRPGRRRRERSSTTRMARCSRAWAWRGCSSCTPAPPTGRRSITTSPS
jgi:cobalt-zinc-cadmium efflux system outer membrane protein